MTQGPARWSGRQPFLKSGQSSRASLERRQDLLHDSQRALHAVVLRLVFHGVLAAIIGILHDFYATGDVNVRKPRPTFSMHH